MKINSVPFTFIFKFITLPLSLLICIIPSVLYIETKLNNITIIEYIILGSINIGFIFFILIIFLHTNNIKKSKHFYLIGKKIIKNNCFKPGSYIPGSISLFIYKYIYKNKRNWGITMLSPINPPFAIIKKMDEEYKAYKEKKMIDL